MSQNQLKNHLLHHLELWTSQTPNHACRSTLKVAQFCSGGTGANFDGRYRHGGGQMPRHDASKKCTFCTILHHFPISRNIAKTRHAHCSALKVLQFCSGGVKATFYRVFHHQKADMCRNMPPYPKIGSKSTFCTIWSLSGAMDIKNTRSRMSQPPGSRRILLMG